MDRSRIEDGRGHCMRERGLGYHLGPFGYGIQKKGTRLPLMTGIAGHDGLAPILKWCSRFLESPEMVKQQLATGQAVPNEIVRAAILAAQTKYWAVVEARGFAYLENEPGVRELTTEQQYLIEGLIWAWVLEVLPEVLQRGYVLEVEQEGVYIIGCTCGLGDGILGQAEHDARACQGIGFQNRPDFLLDTWITHELEYHEFKSLGADMPSFRDKHEVSIQMFASTLDAERRLGRHVQSFYVHGLIKGKREGEYNYETKKKDGTIRQQSLFCYAYRKPANPPMESEEWRALYEWWDEYEQKTKRLPKVFQKAPVWDLDDSVLTGTDIVSKAEFWVKWIPTEARQKSLLLLGPFSRQTLMVEGFLQEVVAEEARWQAAVWQLYDLYTQLVTRMEASLKVEVTWKMVWIHPEYQALLNVLLPRSYQCRRFGKRYACQFEMLCFYREGWADPLNGGHYLPRRPHHQPELDQAVGRGLLPPVEGLAEGEEDGE